MRTFDSILAITSPLRLEYFSIPNAALLFLLFALPVVLMGMKSLAWLGATRKWVAISVRLSLIWVLVLLIAGAQWVRINRDLEVVVLRDVSTSTTSVKPPAGKTLVGAIDEMLQSDCRKKRAGDRIGIVGFAQQARIDTLPEDHLRLDAHPIAVGGDGTDIASALRLGLASFREDAVRRLVLVSDGNATQGDTDSALRTVTAMHIPVDVLPLHYEIRRDVLFDSLLAPTWQRTGEPFSLDLILRSSSVAPVTGTVTITQQGLPMDLDPETEGVQPMMRVDLRAGATAFHVRVPAQLRPGLEQFHATFQADRASDDALAGNNSADAFTFARGKAQYLFVDNSGLLASGEPASAGGALLNALSAQHIEIPPENHITPQQFPTHLIDLQPYDAIILADVPRGPGGLSLEQDRLLARYVRDLGGGVVVIGGPQAFGAGNWRGSELEKVLPVDCEIRAERIFPAGAMVIVLDHSGSMTEPMPGSSDRTKQQVATESAILSLQALQRDDLAGVVVFAQSPQWIVNLSPNSDQDRSATRIRNVRATEGTNICPALEEACAALEKVPDTQASTKRILLLTDGVSEAGNYDALLSRMHASRISLSTIAIGGDADLRLLRYLAGRANGAMYAVDSPEQLRQVFVREARELRRQLIHEPPGGIELVQTSDEISNLKSEIALPKLSGMVLTALKRDPFARASIFAAGKYHDPILASWQAGMGRTAVFTGDATTRWAARWIESPMFGAFWAKVVRDVARPPIGGEFDVRMTRSGATTHLVVEALRDDGTGHSFLSFAGKLAGPDPDAPSADISLQQTGPGVYEANLATPLPGTYAAAIRYQGRDASGSLVAGICVPQSVELRDTQSNEAALAAIADCTGGRILPPLDQGGSTGLFDREGLSPSVASRPINDLLLCILMGMLVTDVAVRRIHWDWIAMKRWAFLSVAMVQGFTTTRKINAQPTLSALKKVHEKQTAPPTRTMILDSAFAPRTASEKQMPKPLAQSSLSCLKAAKVRAMEEIRERGKS